MLVSASVNLQGLSIIVKLRGQVMCGLMSIIRKDYHIGRTLVHSGHCPNLCLLPATRAESGDTIGRDRVGGLIRRLGRRFSCVLLSYPTNVRRKFGGTVTNTSQTLIIAAPRISTVHSTSHVVNLLRTSNFRHVSLIVGQVHCRVIEHKSVVDMSSIISVLSVPLVNIIPSSRGIIVTAGRNRPLINGRALTKHTCQGVYRQVLKRRAPCLLPRPAFSF